MNCRNTVGALATVFALASAGCSNFDDVGEVTYVGDTNGSTNGNTDGATSGNNGNNGRSNNGDFNNGRANNGHAECTDFDADQDGAFGRAGCEPFDCDDDDATRAPNLNETCDGIDNDCDDQVDEGGVCDSDCSSEPCAVGAAECTSATMRRRCDADDTGCGIWGAPAVCDDGGACDGGDCITCVDGDGDGRGVGCAAGADCDDNNAAVYDGAEELCDGLDNDCDGDADEDFEQLGEPCMVGTGVCEAVGELVCDEDGLRCDGVPGEPTSEICDDVDNDCDGEADENGVCDTCIEDQYEDNDSREEATDLPIGSSLTAVACGIGEERDDDWFALGNLREHQPVTLELESHTDGCVIHLEVYGPSRFLGATDQISGTGSVIVTVRENGYHYVWVVANETTVAGCAYTVVRL